MFGFEAIRAGTMTGRVLSIGLVLCGLVRFNDDLPLHRLAMAAKRDMYLSRVTFCCICLMSTGLAPMLDDAGAAGDSVACWITRRRESRYVCMANSLDGKLYGEVIE